MRWRLAKRDASSAFRGALQVIACIPCISPKLIPLSKTCEMMPSSPPAKGRAHEASCSVGRGAVSVLPFRKRGAEAAEARQRRAPSAAHPCPRRAVLKAGEGQPRLARTGKPAPGPWWSRGRPSARSRLAFALGPGGAGAKTCRGGRSAERPIDYWLGTHRAPATPSPAWGRGPFFEMSITRPSCGAGTRARVRNLARDRNWSAS